MCGVQGFNNNADNYFKGWDKIRNYLYREMEKLKKNKNYTLKEIGGKLKVSGRMVGHWITESQWAFITENHYKSLQSLSNNAFKKEYSELKKEYYSTRAYFDNTHDNMNNVWSFNRTTQKERVGDHATLKPIDLCSRAIKSSCPEGGLTVDFFLGSGSTLIACEKTNRRCFGMELDPKYCDVIITRWQNFTGQKAKLINA